jgi:acyl CoA:acetate/3-ketoacid CoA transferase alpha subunit
VKAWKGDRMGNLVYRHTARNFNPMMAMAGRVTIAEVEELVEPGQLEPDGIHTRGSSCSASSRARTTRSGSSSAPPAQRA